VDSEAREISGEHLATARRAVSVALMVDVAAEDVHAVRALLPPQSDLVRLLDRLGWPGSDEHPAALSARDRRVLERVVYATLILSIGEAERVAYTALRALSGTRGIDTVSFSALASLADLVLWLHGEQTRAANLGTADTDAGGRSPAIGALADTIALPVWVTDANFTIEWANPAFRELLGEAASVTGTSCLRWCDPDDVPKLAQVLAAASLEHRNFTVEVGVGAPSGPRTRLLVVAAPRIAAAGTLLGWTGIGFDISGDAGSRSRVEALITPLTVASARNALLIEEIPGDLWTTDADLRMTSGMGASWRDPGRPGPRLGVTIPELVGTEDPDHPVIRAHRGALSGRHVQYQYATEERELDARVRPLLDASGEIVGCIGLALDITGAVRAGRRSAQLARQLAFAQRIGRIGSWETDLITGAGLWSDEAFRVLGLEPDAVAPSFDAFLERVHPDDRKRIAAIHREGVRTGEGYEVRYRAVLPDGTIRQMRGVVEFDTDNTGKVTRIAGILQDMTAHGGASGA
jgi:PAS domain-containing protein